MIGHFSFYSEPSENRLVFSDRNNNVFPVTWNAPFPKPRINMVTVPGRHGSIDYSDFFGETILDRTTVGITFAMIPGNSIITVTKNMLSKLNGRELFFRNDRMEAGKYYKGRVSVSTWQRRNGTVYISVSADVEPFLYGSKVSGSFTVTSRTMTAFTITSSGDYRSPCSASANGSVAFSDMYGNVYEQMSDGVSREFSCLIAAPGGYNNYARCTAADPPDPVTVEYSYYPLYFFVGC